ncbi:MAG: 3-hydroxyacyl-CoA dehydrogenase family protein [Pelistega sp.]|nr:3-hydroxyacyl-CoA dehydrogenase family protein [Pelistega sp.]
MNSNKNIAVLGAGTMGHGIAQLYAISGYQVMLYDINENAVNKGFEQIKASLQHFADVNLIEAEHIPSILSNIHLTTSIQEAVTQASIITEAAPEVLDLKYQLFKNIEEFASPEAIILSNTSSFAVEVLAKGIQHKNRFLITHFFNPAQIVPLVEIVANQETTPETVSYIEHVMRVIGKEPVVLLKDKPGFIANRLQAALAREALSLLNEGIATAKSIDTAITAGPGFRWAFIGPLETADFGGLDIWRNVLNNLAPTLNNTDKAPELIETLVENKQLGVKTGSGIYDYPDNSVAEKIADRDHKFLLLNKLKKEN